MDSPFVQAAIYAYSRLVALAMPVVLLIGSCNIGINMIIGAFMGGKLRIGGRN